MLDLVARAQAHDRDAFEMLVEQHLASVYRIAVAIVGPSDAMDITQETFVTAWQQLPRLRNRDSFAGWLRRICVNHARKWLSRASRGGPVASLDAEEPGAPVGLTDDRLDFRVAVEARAIFEPAIERLSPDQRAILALHYGLGFSIAEAAKALDVPVGTAKSRLNASLNVLRGAATLRAPLRLQERQRHE